MGRARQDTPTSVRIRFEPRPIVSDPTLGIQVDVARDGVPPNRLVTVGDSITQGFQSAAIFKTDRSWPALVADALGLQPQVDFRYPVYEPADGPGGLPLDLERAVRSFQKSFGDGLDWRELLGAARWLRHYMDEIEDYWEGRGRDTFHRITPPAPYHNLAVYGADLVDALVLNLDIVEQRLMTRPDDDFLAQQVEHDNDHAWRVVLDSCGSAGATVLDAARAMGAEGDGSHGIETLVVALGANNALGSVVRLDPRWTDPAYGNERDLRARLDLKSEFNVWQPVHFEYEWDRLVEQIRTIRARHVIFATVPQVTIAPVTRGVGGKIDPRSRYFTAYTRPWIDDRHFDKRLDPWIDADQARGIDSAIDAFNERIIASVRAERRDPIAPLDWYVFDLGGLLDRMAVRRYVETPDARPWWWTPYDLPPEIDALQPPVDTRFFSSGPTGRLAGGLFSLDGVHPTTIASGVIAREIVRIMDRHAGVTFPGANGPRPQGSVDLDFATILTLDSLISDPPDAVQSLVSLLGWFDDRVDWVRRLLPF